MRPRWVRALIVVCLLSVTIPMARAAGSHLPVFFPALASRLDAEQTAAALMRRLSRLQKRSPDVGVRCEAHDGASNRSPARDGAWDYICTYVDQPQSSHPKRVELGVRVGADAIVDVSSPHAVDAQYVRH